MAWQVKAGNQTPPNSPRKIRDGLSIAISSVGPARDGRSHGDSHRAWVTCRSRVGRSSIHTFRAMVGSWRQADGVHGERRRGPGSLMCTRKRHKVHDMSRYMHKPIIMYRGIRPNFERTELCKQEVLFEESACMYEEMCRKPTIALSTASASDNKMYRRPIRLCIIYWSVMRDNKAG